MKDFEILAPAGGKDSLIAAVYSGADAVYLGVNKFSARDSAANFSTEELEENLKFARVRGVKIYVAINTIIKDSEVNDLLELLEFLCKISVDAVIVQDLGIYYIIKEVCKGLEVHSSTQLSVMNSYGVKFAEKLGATRVVLARELSINEIKKISDNTSAELEVFVHGALCMSVSGQCYFSAMLGSRSGNRGKCAQPCRLPFKVHKGTGFDLSLKDLSLIDNINELKKAGVCSAKIEGRMKRPEYVAAAVNAVKQKLETDTTSDFVKESLEQVFSRSGFTDGYYKGNLGKNMFGIRTAENVKNSNTALYNQLHELYKREYQSVAIHGNIYAYVCEKIALTVTDNLGNTVSVVSENAVEQAVNKSTGTDMIKEKLSKLGGTPYYFDTINVETDEKGAVPVSVLNKLKREAVDLLSQKREKSKEIPFSYILERANSHKSQDFKLRAEFLFKEQIPNDISMFDIVYVPISFMLKDILELKDKANNIAVVLPRALFDGEEVLESKIKELIQAGVCDFVCPNVYALELVKNLGGNIHGAYSLNIANSYSLKVLEDFGAKSAEISYELTLKEIEKIGGSLERGIMVYGRQALMLTRNSPKNNSTDKSITDKNIAFLTDRKNTKFPIICHNFESSEENLQKIPNYTEVFNSVSLSLSDKLNDVKNVDYGILRFTVEKKDEIERIIEFFIRQKPIDTDFTRGLFYRGIL